MKSVWQVSLKEASANLNDLTAAHLETTDFSRVESQFPPTPEAPRNYIKVEIDTPRG